MTGQDAANVSDANPLEPVSIEASLTDSGVSLNTRSRFVSAVDRMFGGLFAVPAALLEGRAARTKLLAQIDRDRIEARSKLELAGELKLKEFELAAECVAKERETRRLLNLASVTQLALEDLRDTSAASAEPDIPGDISDDWLNWFQSYAEKATSDDIQQIWGRILAGESKKPGSISLTTLRVLSETDQRLAELFQKYTAGAFMEQFIFKSDKELKGEKLLDLTALEDAGYLREVNGMLGLTWKFDDKGQFVQRGSGNIVFVAEGPPGLQFRVSVILISRAGRELLTVLPAIEPDMAFRRLVELLPPATTSIKLGTVVAQPTPGEISWTEIERLK
jgi:hypothetical protein